MLAWAGALLALLLFSAPASAITQQGHEFASSFGAGELSKPAAVAVSESSGDIYVLDSGHNRVMVYGPNHEFLAAWGAGVGKLGEKAYEVCSSECKAGVAGFGKGQFENPVAIAVDNAAGSPSKGDVYVVANRTAKKAVIDKFNPAGELIDRLLAGKEEREEFEENPIVGVAVGPAGTVWVEREAEEEEIIIERFGNGVSNAPVGVPGLLNYGEHTGVEEEALSGPVRPGFAVDAQGAMYVTYEPEGHTLVEQEEEEEEIKENEKERKEEKEPPLGEKPQLPCEKHPCLTVKLDDLHEVGEELWARFANNPLSFESSTGLAADGSSGAPSSGDAYVDEGTSVTAFTPSGAVIQNFGSGHIGEGAGVAVNSKCGAPCALGSDEILVADAGGGTIDLFTPSKPSVPVISPESPSVAHVSDEAAELRGTVDPSGAEAHYRFQYGQAPCSEAGACREAPEPPAAAGVLGQGFGDRTAAQMVSGLAPETVYHIRLEVEYSFEEGGSPKTGTVFSEERTFTTASATPEATLPDARAWELVSPPNKHGASIEPAEHEGGVVQASADGNSITYMATGPFGENEPEGYRGPERSQMFATRSASGWSTRDIATPNTGALGGRPGLPREYEFFSSDLQSALLQPEDRVPLSKKTTEPTIYLRHDATCVAAPEECFEPLVDGEDVTSKNQFNAKITLEGSSPDGKHVLISSLIALTPGGPSQGLYEWSQGALTPVSFLPEGKPTQGQVFLGAGSSVGSPVGRMIATAVSHDGNRVEWYVEHNPHLYTRDVAGEKTLQVDELESGVAAPKTPLVALFQTASADGSKIFFTDGDRLTSNSRAIENGEQPDLYVFEPEKPEGHRVTDLSVPLGAGEDGAVQGAVVGASEDGSLVYFVANGVLSEGAKRGGCGSPSGSGCNLYVVQDGSEGWGKPELIARLSTKDNPDWAEPDAENQYHLALKPSEVSSNGRYLAFMSENSLTGYNNVDANSGFRDEEVFMYERLPHEEGPEGEEAKGRLLCPSCDPSGAQPVGVFDTEESGEGNGLLVDRAEIWEGVFSENTARWLAGSLPGWTSYALQSTDYQPRYLDDSGRLFFNSSDALVRRDTNGSKADVYEYEPQGLGSCSSGKDQGGCVALISSGESERESAFLDASEEGKSVFFLTSAKLSPLDEDTSVDVYDARICGVEGAEPCATLPPSPPPPCSGEACKAPPHGPESYESPSTTVTGASGNQPAKQVLGTKTETPANNTPKPLTTAQKLAKALKACHKIKSKHKRASCEKAAHKKYPAKKASKAAKKASTRDRAGAARRHR